MNCSLSKLTSFDVEDQFRPWGKIRDFLIEFPSGCSRYFSVNARVGIDTKEIWAPLETVTRVDPKRRSITVLAHLDHDLSSRLARLETPARDSDELKLHRFYHTQPAWVEICRKKGGKLRKRSRLLRGSWLIGYNAILRNSRRGWISDLLFDEKTLSLMKLRMQFDGEGDGMSMDLSMGRDWILYPEAQSLYINFD